MGFLALHATLVYLSLALNYTWFPQVFNESLASIQNDLDRFNTSHLKEENRVRELHEKRPGYERKEETYKIPSKDGVRIVRKGKLSLRLRASLA